MIYILSYVNWKFFNAKLKYLYYLSFILLEDKTYRCTSRLYDDIIINNYISYNIYGLNYLPINKISET